MSTVFDTTPPNFSIVEIKEILLSFFKIVGQPILLYSDRDQIFYINSSLNQKYILKISNPSENIRNLEIQNKAISLIQTKDSKIKLPIQIGEIVRIKKNGNKFYVRLLEYIEGNFFNDINIVDISYLKIGKFFGRLSQSLAQFEQPSTEPSFEWDVRNIKAIRSRLSFLDNQSEKSTVLHFLNEYESNVMVHSSNLRHATIHNDGNEHNILVDNLGNAVGIIDFGDMVYSYQVAEPAVCMAYIGLGKKQPFLAMFDLLKGYHSSFPLNHLELKSVLYLSCIRLCISVTMSAWRTKLFPSNDYLRVSQNKAWALLRKIELEDLNELSDKIIIYAK